MSEWYFDFHRNQNDYDNNIFLSVERKVIVLKISATYNDLSQCKSPRLQHNLKHVTSKTRLYKVAIACRHVCNNASAYRNVEHREYMHMHSENNILQQPFGYHKHLQNNNLFIFPFSSVIYSL